MDYTCGGGGGGGSSLTCLRRLRTTLAEVEGECGSAPSALGVFVAQFPAVLWATMYQSRVYDDMRVRSPQNRT